MDLQNNARTFGVILACAITLSTLSCSQDQTSGNKPSPTQPTERTRATTTSTPEKTTAATKPVTEKQKLARARIGPKEITNMLPAGGKKPDPPQPLPKNPPKGIRVYPATGSATTKEPIEYARKPPTNGLHDPLWQNCGYYSKPIENRHAVHSLDHGVVWITYQPDLPQQQIQTLRSYGEENYVIVSPYPGQSAPVTVTSWRIQLKLHNASDPRLRQFVDQFRRSELAPLSGNRCVLGVGKPGYSG